MKRTFRTFTNKASRLAEMAGLQPHVGWKNLTSIRWYLNDLAIIKRQLRGCREFPLGKLHPVLQDKHAAPGSISGHYLHQDLLVAQCIFRNAPRRHVDIGSRFDGFITHVASFREIEVLDIRKAEVSVDNVTFTQGNLMELPVSMVNSTDSISALHVIEHFGLGRYNDPIDVNGHLKGIANLTAMLESGGRFYFSTPIGPQRIEFNAHRVFSIEYLLRLFRADFNIESFSYVGDDGNLRKHIFLDEGMIASNCGCIFGCGIFELIKR